ncbi:hypothetical protein L228DRAFT_244777 [Xylona heveae TC161]|uniref:Uncharacterized protein n=1 Tax=Xylona heveae (strain CBS 132557 / TC161) TaxID=1328760 RepID=A0A165J7C9_XYLHT|nr:hypothetical protein L228DRAFT_244777 [Xylona heveae TC161]KZF25841.1 hypothetical protein L228DRAFT_244777 [Xylona heveae TC161]
MSHQCKAENSSSSSSKSDHSDSSQLHLQANESADEEILQAYLRTVTVLVEELNTSWVHSTHGNQLLNAHHMQHLQHGHFSKFQQLETLGRGQSPILYTGQHQHVAILALQEQIVSPDKSVCHHSNHGLISIH